MARPVFPSLEADLRAYCNRASDAMDLVERQLRQAAAVAEASVRGARHELAVASDRLRACELREEANSVTEARAVERAKARLERCYSVQREVADLTAGYRPAVRRFASAVEALTGTARAHLATADANVGAYLGAGRSSGSVGALSGGSSAGPRPSPERQELVPVQGAPEGIFLVPLDLIDDSDTRLTSASDFSSHYPAADLEWAHDAFERVVLPGLAAGVTLDGFRARDRQEGRVGTRSYEMTCAGFTGGDAIRLAPKGELLEIENGYHRVFVARAMGLDVVPARVVGR